MTDAEFERLAIEITDHVARAPVWAQGDRKPVITRLKQAYDSGYAKGRSEIAPVPYSMHSVEPTTPGGKAWWMP